VGAASAEVGQAGVLEENATEGPQIEGVSQMAGSLSFPGIDLSAAALWKRQQVDEHYLLRENMQTNLRGSLSLTSRLKLCADVKYISAIIDAMELAITLKGKNEHKIKPCPQYYPGRPRIGYKPPTSKSPKDPA
jgi:hypothetical protein